MPLARPKPPPAPPLEVRIKLAEKDDPLARRKIVEVLARLLFDQDAVE